MSQIKQNLSSSDHMIIAMVRRVKERARIGILSGCIVAALCTFAGPSQAEVKFFQIARLIQFTTDCNLVALNPAAGPQGEMRFKARCSSIISYPDGIDVTCTDAEDERTCRIMTPKKEYKHLDLFRRQ